MMKEDKDMKPIDDLFRQSLEGYTPPPPAGAWKNIRSSLAKGRRSGWYFLLSMPAIILISAIILSISGILLYPYIQSDNHNPKTNSSVLAERNSAEIRNTTPNNPVSKSVNENVNPGNPSSPQSHSASSFNQESNTGQNVRPVSSSQLQPGKLSTVNNERKPSGKISTNKADGHAGLKKQPDPNQNKSSKTPGKTPVKQAVVSITTATLSKNGASLRPETESRVAPEKNTDVNKVEATSAISSKPVEDSSPATKPGTELSTTAVQNANSSPPASNSPVLNDSSGKNAASAQISLPAKKPAAKPSADMRPGCFINIGGSAGEVINKGFTPRQFWTAGATFGLNLSKYRSSLETGLGFSHYKDQGLFEFEFRKTDTSGYTGYTYFNPLDSSYLIIFRANIDTQQIFREAESRYSYTYIDIPLYYTQELFKFSKLTFGIKAGPAVSFLVTKKEAQPSFNLPGAEFVNLRNKSYSRLSLNWQLLIATRFSWQFTEHMSLILQPSLILYLNNLYNKDNKPKSDPFGISIWSGLQYKF